MGTQSTTIQTQSNSDGTYNSDTPSLNSNDSTLIKKIIFKCIDNKWILMNDPSKSFTDIQPIMVKNN